MLLVCTWFIFWCFHRKDKIRLINRSWSWHIVTGSQCSTSSLTKYSLILTKCSSAQTSAKQPLLTPSTSSSTFPFPHTSLAAQFLTDMWIPPTARVRRHPLWGAAYVWHSLAKMCYYKSGRYYLSRMARFHTSQSHPCCGVDGADFINVLLPNTIHRHQRKSCLTKNITSLLAKY